MPSNAMGLASMIGALPRDLRHAVRGLRRAPLFAATATLSLALGLGATTAVFTVANALFLRPAPGVAAPGRLVDVLATRGAGLASFSFPAYLDIRDRSRTLASVFGYQPVATPANLDAGDGAERALVSLVTPNYFSTLGARPALGRLLDATTDGQPTAAAVLQHDFWASRFNADPQVVGRAIRINAQVFTVVGVASAGFHGTTVTTTQLWVSTAMAPLIAGNPEMLRERAGGFLMLGGRLRDGVSAAQASAELTGLGLAVAREHPDPNGDARLWAGVASAIPGNVGPAAGLVAVLMGLVAMLLCVACVNLVSVLLARASTAEREVGIRLAIGAGAGDIVRQRLTETTVLFVLGGSAGLVLARWITTLLLYAAPALPIPVAMTLALDWRVVTFSAVLSLTAALGAGLGPAWQAARLDVLPALRTDGLGARKQSRIRRTLVAAQVAFSTLLIVGAGLLVRALDRATSVDPGYEPRGVDIATVELPPTVSLTTRQSLARALAERASALPGIASVSIASSVPMGDAVQRLQGLTVPGRPAPGNRPYWDALFAAVRPNYFATLRIPVITGRDFTDMDRAGARPVAIVSRATAQRLWPDRSPIGQTIRLDAGPWRTPDRARTVTVVGVVGDVAFTSLADDGSRTFVYLPLEQEPASILTLLVRRQDGARRDAGELRALMLAAAPLLPPALPRALEDGLAASLVPQRLAALVSGFSGAVGLFLATIGIYGLTAFVATSRTREFGVRVALGARTSDIVGLVLRQGLGSAAIGAGAGLLVAAAASRLLTRLLFGLSPLDPVAFGTAVLLLAATALAAGSVPARRAATVDPIVALRAE